MPTVTGGTSASYTFPRQQTVTFLLDSNERTVVSVTRGTVVIFGGNVASSQNIGPYRPGDVMSITAPSTSVDYTPIDYTSATSGASIPTGGTTGQALVKQSNADGDVTWSTGVGIGTVTASAGALTSNAVVLGAGSTDTKVLASPGTATTVLHGNASGPPSFGAVDLTADVTGILPKANGGTGTATPSLVAGANITITGSWPNHTVTGANSGVGGGDALVANPLSQFATTTSAQLRSVMSDETGTGAIVFADSPALTGSPTAPTATAGDNTTKLATTAFIKAAIDAEASGEAWKIVSTTTYTILSTDKKLSFTNAAGCTVTYPAGLPANSEFIGMQSAAGLITSVPGVGTVQESGGSNQSARQGAVIAWISSETANTFTLCGDLYGSSSNSYAYEQRVSPSGGNDLPQFKAALAALALNGGGALIVSSGAYDFSTFSGDSDTLDVSSNICVAFMPGVTMTWGYWGSPLWSVINRQGVEFIGDAEIIWTGTFSTTSGARDLLGYGLARPAYEWCANLVIAGSDYTSVDGLRCRGATTSNNLNAHIILIRKPDGSLCKGNVIENVYINDVCQGIMTDGQQGCVIRNTTGERYSQASNALYGPGHLIYHLITTGTVVHSRDILIDGVLDLGIANGSYVTGGHTLSCKGMINATYKNIRSHRAEGVWNGESITNSNFEELYYQSSSTVTDTVSAAVFMQNPAGTNINDGVRFKGLRIRHDGVRNFACMSMLGITVPADNINCRVDGLDVIRNSSGAENPAVSVVGEGVRVSNYNHTNSGVGAQRVAIDFANGSSDCVVDLASFGQVQNPRITFSSSADCVVYVETQPTNEYDTNEITPLNGNRVIWRGKQNYQSSRVIGVTTNPSMTVQLPKTGVYLLSFVLKTSDNNHARQGSWQIIYDNASANDFLVTTSSWAQVSKGGNAPSVLNLSVTNDGIVTMTSTAPSNTWIGTYGFVQIGPT